MLEFLKKSNKNTVPCICILLFSDIRKNLKQSYTTYINKNIFINDMHYWLPLFYFNLPTKLLVLSTNFFSRFPFKNKIPPVTPPYYP